MFDADRDDFRALQLLQPTDVVFQTESQLPLAALDADFLQRYGADPGSLIGYPSALAAQTKWAISTRWELVEPLHQYNQHS